MRSLGRGEGCSPQPTEEAGEWEEGGGGPRVGGGRGSSAMFIACIRLEWGGSS